MVKRWTVRMRGTQLSGNTFVTQTAAPAIANKDLVRTELLDDLTAQFLLAKATMKTHCMFITTESPALVVKSGGKHHATLSALFESIALLVRTSAYTTAERRP